MLTKLLAVRLCGCWAHLKPLDSLKILLDSLTILLDSLTILYKIASEFENHFHPKIQLHVEPNPAWRFGSAVSTRSRCAQAVWLLGGQPEDADALVQRVPALQMAAGAPKAVAIPLETVSAAYNSWLGLQDGSPSTGFVGAALNSTISCWSGAVSAYPRSAHLLPGYWIQLQKSLRSSSTLDCLKGLQGNRMPNLFWLVSSRAWAAPATGLPCKGRDADIDGMWAGLRRDQGGAPLRSTRSGGAPLRHELARKELAWPQGVPAPARRHFKLGEEPTACLTAAIALDRHQGVGWLVGYMSLTSAWWRRCEHTQQDSSPLRK